jgi:hypothetical protein
MFDLEQSITDWRKQMLAAGIKTPVPLEELESHLREEIERQTRSGLSVQQAFDSAVQQIGQAKTLKSEFAKADRTKAIALRGLKSFLIIVFSAAVVALNIYLASELKAICLIDLGLLSFVLPFMASSRTPKNAADSKRRLHIVWTGQLLMGLCGFLINFSSHPVFGLAASIVSCIVFTLMLRQQIRAAVSRS